MSPYVFPVEYKQPSLEWRCINLLGEIMAQSCQWASNITISILLKKRWLYYVTVSLKQEYHIYMAQLLIAKRWWQGLHKKSNL